MSGIKSLVEKILNWWRLVQEKNYKIFIFLLNKAKNVEN